MWGFTVSELAISLAYLPKLSLEISRESSKWLYLHGQVPAKPDLNLAK